MPLIAFLTDYGLRDEFVGVCHGVIARICPHARVVDVTHGIARQDVASGARVLARALPFIPATVALAVVDPEVGARRRAVALRCADDGAPLLVGPDNGLLVDAAKRFGGVTAAVEISASPWRLPSVSATFHGRDLFSPVAARLAAGEPMEEAGTPLDPSGLVELERRAPKTLPGGGLLADVAQVDAFGNVEFEASAGDLAAAGGRMGRTVTVRAGAVERPVRYVRTFADVSPGEPLLYVDASGRLALAVNTGDAAQAFAVGPGDAVRLSPSSGAG